MTPALVGREAELAALRTLVDGLAAGHGASVLLVGEAGIGKTALAGAARDLAVARGAVAAVGSCWESGGAPAFWPWVQVIRGLLRRGADAANEARAQAGPGLGPVLGELGGVVPDSGSDAEFRVLDALISFLDHLARTHPVVVVLDDLQWADTASVRAAEFVARHLALSPILLVSTERGRSGVHDADPVAALAAVSTNLTLSGLDVSAVEELASRANTSSSPDVDAVALHQRTGGNPFFVEEVLRATTASGAPAATSPGLRQILDTRVNVLGADVVAVLQVAAVIGREFSPALVASVASVDAEAVDAALGSATNAGLVRLAGDETTSFVHDLVRESLLGALEAPRARALHAAVVTTLLAAGDDRRAHPAVLAEHAVLARPDIDQAVLRDCLVAAASDARKRHAVRDETEYLRRAVHLVEGAGEPDLVVDFGQALIRAGELEEARTVFAGLADQARGTDASTFARAALGLHSIGTAIESPEPGSDLLEEAIAAVRATGDGAVLTQVLAARSRELTHAVGGDRARAEAMSLEAVDLARRNPEEEALGLCLLARHDAIWTVGTAPERLALATEMSAVADRSGDVEVALLAGHLRVVALLELGRPDARGEHRAVAALARATRLPRAMYLTLSRDVSFATLDGDFGRASDLVDEAEALGAGLDEPDRAGVSLDQRWLLAYLRDRPDDIEDDLAEARLAGDPHVVVLEALLAMQRGDDEAVVARAARVRELGRIWPRWATGVWLVFEAKLAVAVADPDAIEQARRRVQPFIDTWAVLGGGILVLGSMHHWSAVLAAAAGDLDDAVESFRLAAEASRRFGSRVWEVQAEVGRAEALQSRGRPGDLEQARSLLGPLQSDPVVAALAVERGRIGRILRRLDGDPAGAQDPARAGHAVFRRDDDVWTLEFDGTTVLVPDAKGLGDLHTLLANPGSEIAALDLLHAGSPDLGTAPRSLGADPVLDETARRSYRRRLESIEADLAVATANYADDRVARLDEERDALIAELAKATGLGGRRRRLGDEQERARKTVTARIRDTLRRLDERHPPLARHLREAVTTGAYCRYRPDAGVIWEL